MNETETKSPTYTLIIDENRDMMLTVLLTALERFPSCERFFFEGLEHFEIDPQEFLDFIKEIAEKTHEKGWCKDPHCSEKI